MPSIAILGSCVTRDLFTHLPAALEQVELGPYVSRSTLISMAAAAPRQVVALLREQSAKKFDDRRFIQDARKDHFEILARHAPEFLVLDLIDERHATYLFADGAVTLTKVSRDFLTAHRIQGQARTVAPFSADWQGLVDRSIGPVTERLRKLLPATRFIVHRALHCERYLDGGQVHVFEDLEPIRRWNRYLEASYDALQDRLPAVALQVAPAHALAGGKHLWDRTPFHYDVGYYTDLWSQLRQIIARHAQT